MLSWPSIDDFMIFYVFKIYRLNMVVFQSFLGRITRGYPIDFSWDSLRSAICADQGETLVNLWKHVVNLWESRETGSFAGLLRQKARGFDHLSTVILTTPFMECIIPSTRSYSMLYWLVVWTPLKNISQLGWLFQIYRKIKNVPNHQPVYLLMP